MPSEADQLVQQLNLCTQIFAGEGGTNPDLETDCLTRVLSSDGLFHAVSWTGPLSIFPGLVAHPGWVRKPQTTFRHCDIEIH